MLLSQQRLLSSKNWTKKNNASTPSITLLFSFLTATGLKRNFSLVIGSMKAEFKSIKQAGFP